MVKVRRPEMAPFSRYFRFCNVLHLWSVRAVLTSRVYRLYDTKVSLYARASCLLLQWSILFVDVRLDWLSTITSTYHRVTPSTSNVTNTRDLIKAAPPPTVIVWQPQFQLFGDRSKTSFPPSLVFNIPVLILAKDVQSTYWTPIWASSHDECNLFYI